MHNLSICLAFISRGCVLTPGVWNDYVTPAPPRGGGEGGGSERCPAHFRVYGIFFLSFFFEMGYHKLKFLYRGRPRIVLTQQIIFTRSLNLVPRAFPSKNGWGATRYLREKPCGRGCRSLWIANYNYVSSSSIWSSSTTSWILQLLFVVV